MEAKLKILTKQYDDRTSYECVPCYNSVDEYIASLEHKLKYKKDIVSDQLTADLKLCADESAALDLKMDRIRKEIEVLKTPLAKAEDGKSQ